MVPGGAFQLGQRRWLQGRAPWRAAASLPGAVSLLVGEMIPAAEVGILAFCAQETIARPDANDYGSRTRCQTPQSCQSCQVKSMHQAVGA